MEGIQICWKRAVGLHALSLAPCRSGGFEHLSGFEARLLAGGDRTLLAIRSPVLETVAFGI